MDLIGTAYVRVLPETASFGVLTERAINTELTALNRAVERSLKTRLSIEEKLALEEQKLNARTQAIAQQEIIRTSEIAAREQLKNDALAQQLAIKAQARAKELAAAQARAARTATSGSVVDRELGSVIGGSVAGAEGARIGRLGGLLASAKNVAVALTAGLLIAGGTATHFFTEYEADLNKTAALTTDGAKDIDQMGDALLRLAPKVGEGPKDLADALYFVESDGIRGAKALDVVTQSAKAAAAGMGTTAQVTNAVTVTYQAYAQQGAKAANITSALVAAVAAGHIPADTLATNLGKVVGVAASLGVSLPDLLANISALTRTSGNASFAVTSVQSLLTGLEKLKNASPGQKQALDTLNLSSEQLSDSLGKRGLQPTLALIATAFEDVKASGGNADGALLKLFPNVRALRDILGSAVAQGGAYASIQQDLNKAYADGDRQTKAFAERQKTLAQRFADIKAGAQVAAILLGQQLKPVILDLISGAGHLYDALKPIFGPLVLGGLGALFVTLRGGARLFEDVASFLDHDKAAVAALASAVGVLLLPKLAALAVMAGRTVALNLGAMVLSLKSINPAVLIATAAVAALTYAFVSNRRESEQNRKVAADYAQTIAHMVDPTQVNTLTEYRKQLQQQTQAANDGIVATLRQKDALQQKYGQDLANVIVTSKYKALQQDLNTITSAGRDVLVDTAGAAKQFGVTQADAYAAGAKAGVDYTQSAQQVSAAIGAQLQAAKDSHDPLKVAAADVADMGSASTTAAQAVTDLTNALSGLGDPALNADRAAINFRTDLRNLSQAIKDNGTALVGSGGPLSAATAKADALRGTVQSLASDLYATAEANYANGDSLPSVVQAYAAQYQQLIKTGSALGLNKTQLTQLLTQYQRTPGQVAAALQSTGALKDNLNGAAGGADALSAALGRLPKTISTKVHVTVDGDTTSLTTIDKLSNGNVHIETHKLMASGGRIDGPGARGVDSVPIIAAPGEYMVSADAVAKYGYGFMDAVNSGRLRGYAAGGKIIPLHADHSKNPSGGVKAKGGGKAATVYVEPSAGLLDAASRKVFDSILGSAKRSVDAVAKTLTNYEVTAGKALSKDGSKASDVDRFIARIKDDGKVLNKAVSTRIADLKRLSTAQDKYKTDTAAKAQAFSTQLSTTSGAFDLGAAPGANGDGALTVGGIQSFLSNEATGLQQFNGNLDTLRALGLDPKLIEQIRGQSPEVAARLASVLAKASPDQISSINSTEGALAGLANATATGAANALNGQLASDTAAIRKLTGTTNDELAQIKRLIADLAPAIAHATTGVMSQSVAAARHKTKARPPQVVKVGRS